MLFTSTVEPNTLSILKQLMSIKALDNFYLVGGTCLSLRYGHRTSIDLDFIFFKRVYQRMVNRSVGKRKNSI
jgi:predicted nucleotidyltransferase component of viral defense system